MSADHPLAQEPEPGRPVLLSLEADGTPIPWTALRFGSLPPGAAAPAPPAAGEAVVDLVARPRRAGQRLRGAAARDLAPPDTGRPRRAGAPTATPIPSARVTIAVNPALPAGGRIVHTLADAFTQGEALSAGQDPDASTPEHPDVEIRIETSDRLAAPPPRRVDADAQALAGRRARGA